jgi:hypothetical protein
MAEVIRLLPEKVLSSAMWDTVPKATRVMTASDERY